MFKLFDYAACFIALAFTCFAILPGRLSAALIVPTLLHALFDFPLMLVVRQPNLAGVLPAWILLEVIVTIGVLWWCNRIRTAAGLFSDEPRFTCASTSVGSMASARR